MWKQLSDWNENIFGKGKIAHYEYLLSKGLNILGGGGGENVGQHHFLIFQQQAFFLLFHNVFYTINEKLHH